MTNEYDTPDTEDVLQETDDEPRAVPVTIDQSLRVDEMPCEIGAARNIVLRAGARAEKIANYDARRKRAILWGIDLATGSELVVVSNDETEANALKGVLVWCGTGRIRYEFDVTDELWARPAKFAHTSGILTGIVVSTTDTVLSVLTEQWSR